MIDDNLRVFDVEHCFLTGRIVERQRDQSTLEWKYRVRGLDVSEAQIELIPKFSPAGKLVVITAYAL